MDGRDRLGSGDDTGLSFPMPPFYYFLNGRREENKRRKQKKKKGKTTAPSAAKRPGQESIIPGAVAAKQAHEPVKK